MLADLIIPESRLYCTKCRSSDYLCYCEKLRPFHSYPVFVILMHPKEAKKKIATGRMTHRSLLNSFLYEGKDFSNHQEVNDLIQNPLYDSYLMYPAKNSQNILSSPIMNYKENNKTKKIPLIFMIDGTWSWANRIYLSSTNLQKLPTVHFKAVEQSKFFVRKQPAPQCFATIEAVHHMIDLVGNFAKHRPHDSMLESFDYMVERQLKFAKHSYQIQLES